MVLINVSLPIRLPKPSGQNPIEFSKRLANLPDELKVMIIRHAVSTPKVIDLRQYEQARFTMTEPFRVDDDYLVIAREEFDRVNRFKMPSTFVCSPELAIRIRHLQVYFKLTCMGGTLHANQPSEFSISNQDTTSLANILQIFRRLDSFEIVLDNTGSRAPGIAYRAFGRTLPRSRHPALMAMERTLRVISWINHVRSISLPRWRQGLEVDKRLTFVQNYALQDSGQMKVGVIGQTPSSGAVTGKAKTLVRLYQMLDAPVAIVHYVDKDSDHAARIERSEKEERERELEGAEGMESQLYALLLHQQKQIIAVFDKPSPL